MEATNQGPSTGQHGRPEEVPENANRPVFHLLFTGRTRFQHGPARKGKKGFQGKETVVSFPWGFGVNCPRHNLVVALKEIVLDYSPSAHLLKRIVGRDATGSHDAAAKTA